MLSEWTLAGSYLLPEEARAVVELARAAGIPAVAAGPGTGLDAEIGFDVGAFGAGSPAETRPIEVRVPPEQAEAMRRLLAGEVKILPDKDGDVPESPEAAEI